MPKQIRTNSSTNTDDDHPFMKTTIKFPHFKNTTKIQINIKYQQISREGQEERTKDYEWKDTNGDTYSIPCCYQDEKDDYSQPKSFDEAVDELSKDKLETDDVVVENPSEYGTCCFCGDLCNPCSQACGRCVRNGYYSYGICNRCQGMCHPTADLCYSCMTDDADCALPSICKRCQGMCHRTADLCDSCIADD